MELQLIQKKIFEVRGSKVMFDFDLAVLFETQTKSINLAVKRNSQRFPEDFMFQLTKPEWESLRFQFETSKKGRQKVHSLCIYRAWSNYVSKHFEE